MKILGFNRFELIIALIIIIAAAFLIIPNLSAVLRTSNESAAKKNLNALRSAIALYYSDNTGSYPSENIFQEIAEDKKYINKIPAVNLSKHKKSNSIVIMKGSEDKDLDTGGWAYKVDDEKDNTGKRKGDLWINCSHKNLQDAVWSSL
ncbi:MAG: hypothetical protein LBN20_00345 [Endomicrobium sp.]|jgi:type II secretory pathway pseudopilin PulG|nr:hypothetical protein [Endomicrobium sp.]